MFILPPYEVYKILCIDATLAIFPGTWVLPPPPPPPPLMHLGTRLLLHLTTALYMAATLTAAFIIPG